LLCVAALSTSGALLTHFSNVVVPSSMLPPHVIEKRDQQPTNSYGYGFGYGYGYYGYGGWNSGGGGAGTPMTPLATAVAFGHAECVAAVLDAARTLCQSAASDASTAATAAAATAGAGAAPKMSIGGAMRIASGRGGGGAGAGAGAAATSKDVVPPPTLPQLCLLSRPNTSLSPLLWSIVLARVDALRHMLVACGAGLDFAWARSLLLKVRPEVLPSSSDAGDVGGGAAGGTAGGDGDGLYQGLAGSAARGLAKELHARMVRCGTL
jgi:hypothetical protein